MMSLDTQLQTLINEAPQDGKTPQAVQQIAPILKEIALQIGGLEFYVLQNLEQRWQITTLQNQHNPSLEKTVIFAYTQLQEATRSNPDPQLIAVPIPVTQLLFQLLTMTPVDSIIFQGQSLKSERPIEIQRQQLQQLAQQHLAHFNSVPPDIA